MSNQRTFTAGVFAAFLALTGIAAGQNFQERMAAWQGGGLSQRRVVQAAAQTPATPLPAPQYRGGTAPSAAPYVPAPAQAAPVPDGGVAPPARILAENYSAPSRPLVHSEMPGDCATCTSQFGGYFPEANPGYSCGPGYGGGCGLFGGPGLLGCLFGGCSQCGGFNSCACSGGACGAGACGAGGCDSCGGCGEVPWCNNTMVWARFDVLLWWRQGRDFPVLVTSDPVIESSTTAGILPDAQTIFGGQRVGGDLAAGGRFDIGWWCDPQHCTGYGWRFFGLGRDTNGFTINSNQNPILAIPFTDNSTGTNDALLVAYPGLRSGSISVEGRSGLVGNDLYGRHLLCRDPNSRVDFITGWHYNRLNDIVQIRSTSTVTETGGTIPVGTVTDIQDQFQARNEFNGGILGLMWEQNCGCWNLQALARVALGNMHETMRISGSSTIAVPNQTPETTANGLFSQASNGGQFSRNEFTAIWEAGLNWNWRFAPCTELTVGYTFMYWNDVISPTDGIDTTIGTDGGDDRPQFVFRHSDYWVQGISIGLTQEF